MRESKGVRGVLQSKVVSNESTTAAPPKNTFTIIKMQIFNFLKARYE